MFHNMFKPFSKLKHTFLKRHIYAICVCPGFNLTSFLQQFTARLVLIIAQPCCTQTTLVYLFYYDNLLSRRWLFFETRSAKPNDLFNANVICWMRWYSTGGNINSSKARSASKTLAKFRNSSGRKRLFSRVSQTSYLTIQANWNLFYLTSNKTPPPPPNAYCFTSGPAAFVAPIEHRPAFLATGNQVSLKGKLFYLGANLIKQKQTPPFL